MGALDGENCNKHVGFIRLTMIYEGANMYGDERWFTATSQQASNMREPVVTGYVDNRSLQHSGHVHHGRFGRWQSTPQAINAAHMQTISPYPNRWLALAHMAEDHLSTR
jgi:hypothetical protein